jgi:hypothetical protein
MEFTKENVEKYWKLLNTSKSSEETRVADEYLRQFKVTLFNFRKAHMLLTYAFNSLIAVINPLIYSVQLLYIKTLRNEQASY